MEYTFVDRGHYHYDFWDLKKQNGNTFGGGFLLKYFSLGWVVTIRLLLLAIPAGVVLFGLGVIVGGVRSIEPVGAIFVIAFTIADYVWLGRLIAETRSEPNANKASSNRP